MSLITVDEARARGIALPADDDVAQDIIDEQESWLAKRIGPLTGERTETFYVGSTSTAGRLGLKRYTDDVELTDGTLVDGAAVDPDTVRLVANGCAVVRVYSNPTRWWTGPYVTATYSPNDEMEVRGALFSLIALGKDLPTPYQSEQIGSYSYRVGGGSGQGPSAQGQRTAIADALLPKHNQATTLQTSRPLRVGYPVVPDEPGYPYGDPVINAPEQPL